MNLGKNQYDLDFANYFINFVFILDLIIQCFKIIKIFLTFLYPFDFEMRIKIPYTLFAAISLQL